MRSALLKVTLIVITAQLGNTYIKPELDGRSYFAVNMGNILELHLKTRPQELSYTISPAAVQQSLAILYNSAVDGDDLLDIMLMEMGLKYFDATRLMETAMMEMTSFDALQEDRFEKLDKPIRRTDVLDFFKSDFKELKDKIFYSSTITTPNNLRLSADFIKFAQNFFNTSILSEGDQKVNEIYKTFGLDTTKMSHNCINLFNEIAFKVNLKPSFVETAGHLTTRGSFRYGEIVSSEDGHSSVRVLELPLEADIPLSMVLILPKHTHDLAWTTSYEVIRPLTDRNTVSGVLKEHLVEIKLPKTLNFRTTTNVIEYLRKSSLTRAKIYEAPQYFKRFFDDAPKNGIILDQFWQDIRLEIKGKIVNELPVHHGGFLNTIKEKIIDLALTETFDVTEKPFLYMLKSDDVIYFMGHYYGNKT